MVAHTRLVDGMVWDAKDVEASGDGVGSGFSVASVASEPVAVAVDTVIHGFKGGGHL